MTEATVAAALARAFGRFAEGWGCTFDADDPCDIAGLAHLVYQELGVGLDKEAHRKLREKIEAWGKSDG